MPITLRPTMIRQTFYLLIPKRIAELMEIERDSQISLLVKKVKRGYVLEYSFPPEITIRR